MSRLNGEKRRSYILSYIKRYIEEYGYSPSYKEIAFAVNLSSVSTVKTHLEILRDKGLITFHSTVPRTIRVVDK